MNDTLSRRAFMRASAAAAAAVALPPAPRVCAQTARTTVQIVDIANGAFDKTCKTVKHKFFENLKNNGVKTVIRYYSGIEPGKPLNNAGLTCKNITPEERAIIHDHGLSLGIVYQYLGRNEGRYSESNGKRDAILILPP